MVSYGLSLGGGGSRGAYQLGVWKALIELKIKIDYVVGTSIGAINGAFICQNNYDALEKLWLTTSLKKCFSIEDEIHDDYRLSAMDLPFLAKAMWVDGGLNPLPLKEILKENIDEEAIRNSTIDFGIVTICISSFKPLEIFIKDIPLNKLTDYIMASASLPGFQKFIIDGDCFVDGGLYSNVPSEMLINKKCFHIIEVDIDGPGIRRKIKNKSSMEFIEIKPQESLGSILNFDPKIIEKNINLGYLDTLRAFKKLKGSYYYFSEEGTNTNKLLQKASSKEEELLLNAIGYSDTLYDKITFFRSLKCLKGSARTILSNSNDSMLTAMEITAEALNIERNKIYNYDELLNNIINITSMKKCNFEDINIKEYFLMENCNLQDSSSIAKLFRKTLALTLPKDFIAHMFLSFMKYRLNL